MTDAVNRQRPLTIVQEEIRLTRLAMEVADVIVDAALGQRRRLLDDGWPTGHAMCQDIDKVAEFWAAQLEQQRRALLELLAELDPPGAESGA